MGRTIFQVFVSVLVLGLVTSELSTENTERNEGSENVELEPAMARLIRPQVEKRLEEASISRNAVSSNISFFNYM